MEDPGQEEFRILEQVNLCVSHFVSAVTLLMCGRHPASVTFIMKMVEVGYYQEGMSPCRW